MTVDILFMTKNKLALRVNMCFSNLHSKIFCELPKEDQKKWIFDFDGDDQIYTDQRFIEKVWYACVRHGYISEDYDIMGKFLDAMKVML